MGSTDLALKSARIVDFCGKSSGCADFENTVDRGSAVNFGADSGLCLSWCLDLGSYKSFFSLGRYVSEFIKVIPFSNEAHLNSGVRLLLEFYCMWYSHQACCLRYYLCEVNNGIHIYQFTFDLLHFCFWMWLWFRIWTKILADRWIWRKNGTDRRICIPLFAPLWIVRGIQLVLEKPCELSQLYMSIFSRDPIF